MSNPKPNLTAIGATHLDETARLTGALQPAASNPASWTRSVGGVAANVCRSASQWVSTSLIAALGDDSIGADIQDYFSTSPVDTAFQTLHDCPTGRYTAILDQQGELILGLADTEISERLYWDMVNVALTSVSTPDLLVIDANLSTNCIRDICAHRMSNHLAAVAVSPVKSMRLVDHASAIDTLFANRAEAAMMTGLPRNSELQELSTALNMLGFHHHVLTDGAAALLVNEGDKPVQHLSPAVPAEVTGVNGAGDALAGASLAGLLLGESLSQSVEHRGLPAAMAVVTQSESSRIW